MAESYTNEYSKLPNQIMTRHYFKDIDDTVAPYVNQIKMLQMQGKYDEVNEIIEAHPELVLYINSADYLNAIDEETRNLEIMAKSKKQNIYYQSDKPKNWIVGDVWIE